MLKSLRGRLFSGLTAVIVLAGGIGGWRAYKWAYHEAIEVQDSVLMQLGTFAAQASIKESQSIRGVDADAEVRFVELGASARSGREDDRRLWELRDGLHDESRDGQAIRALLHTRADGSRFALIQLAEFRDEIARHLASRALLPIAALVPCLLLITALIIAHAFKPMIRLAAEIDARAADDFNELAATDAPGELHPFLVSINGLMGRMRVMVNQQKRFIADAAHELRTPITALSVQAENLELLDMPAPARVRLVALRSGMKRTKRLLEQLLALAHQDATQVAAAGPVRLDRIAKEVVAGLLPDAMSRNVDLGFEGIEEISVICEPTALTSAVRNLVENAVKFTPDGGRVDLGVHLEAGAAFLRVEDSGPGIPPGDLDRIFEPFFRGEAPVGEGSGLGLSIAKRIVDRFGGSIELENIAKADRFGLRATLRLPAYV